MKRNLAVRAAGAALLFCLVSANNEAFGLIVGGDMTGGTTGGAFTLVAPPAAIGPDTLESPNLVAFNERQDVTLLAPLPLRPGVVAGPGSVLSSHYVAFDPASPGQLMGFVDFNEPIVGVLRGAQVVETSRLFGLPFVAYSGAPGFGPDPNDTAQPAPGMPRRLLVEFAADSPGDHVRVLTGRLVPVPEPAACAGALVALAAALARRL